MRSKVFVVNLGFSTAAMLGVSCAAFAAEPASTSNARLSGIAPYADKLLTKACQALSSANAFTFHAEITFDQVLPPDVKVQFAGAMDYAVQRPDQLAIDYASDLGAKELWYSGDTLTILDSPHMAYTTLTVPPTLDGMLDRIADMDNLTFPLSDFAASDLCQVVHKQATYGGYVGVGDVNGVDCDHVAFSSPTADFQLWLDRSGKPIPRKVVINYRSLPGSPEYVAVLSDWKFPEKIKASRFQPDVPKDVKRIEFLKVKESKP